MSNSKCIQSNLRGVKSDQCQINAQCGSTAIGGDSAAESLKCLHYISTIEQGKETEVTAMCGEESKCGMEAEPVSPDGTPTVIKCEDRTC